MFLKVRVMSQKHKIIKLYLYLRWQTGAGLLNAGRSEPEIDSQVDFLMPSKW